MLYACSGGDSSGASSEESQHIGNGLIQFKGLENAHIEVFKTQDLQNPLCKTKAQAGEVVIPQGCVEAGGIYWVEAKSSTNMLCAVIPFESLQKLQQWHISELSDILCQSVHSYLTTGPQRNELLSTLDRVSQYLLNSDIDGDGLIQHSDIVSWQIDYPSNVDLLIHDRDFPLQPTDLFSSNQLSDVLIARIDTQRPVHKVIVDSSLAYVVSDVALLIIDVSEPKKPALLSVYPTGWVQDLTLLDSKVFLSLGLQGIEIVDVKDPTKPVFADLIKQTATALANDGNKVFYVGTDADDMLVGSIHNGAIDHTYQVYLPQDVPWLFKVVADKLTVVSTNLTESSIWVFDTQTLELLFTKNLQDDYDLPNLTRINDIFFGRGQTQIVLDWPQYGLFLLTVESDDYSQVGRSDEFVEYSLIDKNNISVIRSRGEMRMYEAMDYKNPVSTIKVPDDVQLIYFENVFKTLTENPDVAVMKMFSSTGYLKRFQLSANNRYSFFASDKYGFSVLDHYPSLEH